ncbi:MAG: superoxide dismutase, partial [Simkaniaceae bacterium]|nr:superoxide dismutase [Simkaniaceae bacterium]
MSLIQKCLLVVALFSISFGSLFGSSKEYSPKNFTYLLGQVHGIDDALLKMHFTLYEGYVQNTNELIQAVKNMEEEGLARTLSYGALKRRFGWEYDGMYLHELYFENLGKQKPLSSAHRLYRQIVREFGTFQAWKENFKDMGMIRGIGWVILYQDPNDGRLYNVWINEHDLGHLAGGKLLLVMDVWEHAYLTEFGLDR